MTRLINFLTITALTVVVGILGCNWDGRLTPGDIAEGEVATGEVVTVRGTLQRQLDARTFTMAATTDFFSSDMAVVSRSDLAPMREGDEIEVTGTVQNVGRIEIEQETNWQFNPQVTIELEDVTGYLVADSVRIIDPR